MAQQGKNAADPSSVNPLIVENDVSTMECLEQAVSALGYPVRTIANGLAAVAEIREEV